MNPFLQSPFVQIALPIMITLVATIWIASWSQNKRFDDLRQDMDRRFSELRRDLDQIIAGSIVSSRSSKVTNNALSGWKSGLRLSGGAIRESGSLE